MPHNHPSITLAKELISRPSVTPDDAGCQELLAKRLQSSGFTIQHLPFGAVKNLWAKRGSSGPLFVFAGHTDVVPPGPLATWSHPPFSPTLENGFLYGRGAADMKSSIAAMVVAVEQFIAQNPDHAGSIAFLMTSDEEGPALEGTQKVVEHLKQSGENITWCLVGEPSSERNTGDMIKNGRRGSLNGKLIISGKQGHIAYPHLADNPIHRSLEALSALCQETWDKGHDMFQPTCFQLSNIHAGTGATNVIPGHIEVTFNFRYSPSVTVEELQQRLNAVLDRHRLSYTIEWMPTGAPFLTPSGQLLDAVQQAIMEVTGKQPKLSTDGGTSDGRFIAPLGCEVLELGPCNATIHQVNERVSVDDVIQLTQIYASVLSRLL